MKIFPPIMFLFAHVTINLNTILIQKYIIRKNICIIFKKLFIIYTTI